MKRIAGIILLSLGVVLIVASFTGSTPFDWNLGHAFSGGRGSVRTLCLVGGIILGAVGAPLLRREKLKRGAIKTMPRKPVTGRR